MAIDFGDLITFTYPAVHQQGTVAHDRYPQVFVLHPNYGGLMHGLNFNYLSDDEINTFRMLIDPFFYMRFGEALKRKNFQAFNIVEDIVHNRGAHRVKIHSPQSFYRVLIKPFITTGKHERYDPYRKYSIQKMKNIRALQKSQHMLGKDYARKFAAGIQDGGTEAAIFPFIKKEFVKSIRTAKTVEDREKLLQWYNKRVRRQRRTRQKDVVPPPVPPGTPLQSLFQWYKDIIQNRRGPRLPNFGR